MGNSTLHAIVIHELRNSNPEFHSQYCELIDGISEQIRQVIKDHKKAVEHTWFIETFDRSNNEPVLQIVIGINRNNFQLFVHIHKEHFFLIRQDQELVKAMTASEALGIMKSTMDKIGLLGWLLTRISQIKISNKNSLLLNGHEFSSSHDSVSN